MTTQEELMAKLSGQLGELAERTKRIESKMDSVLALVDLIPNPFLRKAIRNKITAG